MLSAAQDVPARGQAEIRLEEQEATRKREPRRNRRSVLEHELRQEEARGDEVRAGRY